MTTTMVKYINVYNAPAMHKLYSFIRLTWAETGSPPFSQYTSEAAAEQWRHNAWH